MIEANTLVTDLGARQRALEEELVRAANERDAQRVAAERKAQEVEAQAAELQRKEAELQGKEAELRRKKATIAMLSTTLTERDAALAEQEAALSGSSVASRLRSLGGRVAEHIKSTFRLGVQRALAMASTHYDMDLERVLLGYIIASGIGADAASAAMDDADAAIEEFATVLARKLEDDIPP